MAPFAMRQRRSHPRPLPSSGATTAAAVIAFVLAIAVVGVVAWQGCGTDGSVAQSPKPDATARPARPLPPPSTPAAASTLPASALPERAPAAVEPASETGAREAAVPAASSAGTASAAADVSSVPDAVSAEDEAALAEVRRAVPEPAGLRRVRVASVVDGDTIALEGGEKVRYIGINTPERGEPLYEEATALNRALVGGKEVGIVGDAEARDQYGRSLAYVFVGGRFVNGEIVRFGFAYTYRWEPNTKHAAALLAFQKAARTERRGLFALPLPDPEDEYVADARGHVFHRPECPLAKSIRPERRLTLGSRDEALDTGRTPDRKCKP